jgi:hypothetical protein
VEGLEGLERGGRGSYVTKTTVLDFAVTLEGRDIKPGRDIVVLFGGEWGSLGLEVEFEPPVRNFKV